LGWQLGLQYEQRQFKEQLEHLEFLYTGRVGSGQTVIDPENEVDITLLWSVWRFLSKNYIDPADLKTNEMLYGATSGLVDAVGDVYTTFMTPNQNDDFQDSLLGRLQGIGAELTYRKDQVVVVAPLKGSPAEGVGLMPEDVITHVDGESIAGQSLGEVVQKIRGEKGTKVTLTVWRPETNGSLDFTITRDDIKVPSVESEIKKMDKGSIAYIAVNRFGDATVQEVKTALEGFENGNGHDGLIVDVRFNGGGYLEKAIELSSLFLGQGKVVSVQRREGDPINHYVSGHPVNTTIPMVVLINEGSASASEIFAGALQDAERATIVGKQSFGKGTVQEVFTLPGGSSVRITIAKWLTPGGRDLSKEGVEPDIEAERTREDFDEDRDPQLDAAIEFLLNGE